jgi:hypothetical protein
MTIEQARDRALAAFIEQQGEAQSPVAKVVARFAQDAFVEGWDAALEAMDESLVMAGHLDITADCANAASDSGSSCRSASRAHRRSSSLGPRARASVKRG